MTPETFTALAVALLLLWFLWPAIRAWFGPSVASVIAVRNERLGRVTSSHGPDGASMPSVLETDGPETETDTPDGPELVTAAPNGARLIEPLALYRALRAEGVTREAGKRICKRLDLPLNTNTWAAARPDAAPPAPDAPAEPAAPAVLNIRTNAATYAVIGEQAHA